MKKALIGLVVFFCALPSIGYGQYVQTTSFHTISVQDMDAFKIRTADALAGTVTYSDFAGSASSLTFIDQMNGDENAGTSIKILPLSSGQSARAYIDLPLPPFTQDMWIGEINVALWLENAQASVNICPSIWWEVFNFCTSAIAQDGVVFPEAPKSFTTTFAPAAITTGSGGDMATQFKITYPDATGFQRTTSTSNFLTGPDGLYFLDSQAGCHGVRIFLGRTNRNHSNNGGTTLGCGVAGNDTGTTTNMYLKSLSITLNKCTTTPCTLVP